MALIKCPECGKEVSDRAAVCIHCGFPISELGANAYDHTDTLDQEYEDDEDLDEYVEYELYENDNPFKDYETKDQIQLLLEACKKFDKVAEFSYISAAEMARVDLINIALYCACADGRLSEIETDCIYDYLGVDDTPSKWMKYVKNQNIYSDEFEEKVPLLLERIVEKRRILECFRMFPRRDYLEKLYIDTLLKFGKVIIDADGPATTKEIYSLGDYITMLEDYVDESYEGITDADDEDTEKGFSSYHADDGEAEDYDEYIAAHAYEEEGKICVRILGRDFIIPNYSEIKMYRKLIDSLADIYTEYCNELAEVFRQVTEGEKKDWNKGYYMQTAIWDEITGLDGTISQMVLENMESYGDDACPEHDTDKSAYSTRTRGYNELKKTIDSCVEDVKVIYNAREEMIENGEKWAYRHAESNFTGPSYGIITSSAIELFLFSAISNVGTYLQCKKADKQFQEEASNSAKRAYGYYAGRISSVYNNRFIPAIERYSRMWMNEVAERAITFEANDFHPLYADIRKFDQVKAERMVNEIEDSCPVDLAKEKLQEAFEVCPFCKAIYLKINELGIMDESTLRFAENVGVEL